MRDLKAMELTRVLAYSQLLTELTDDMTRFGKMVSECYINEGIQEYEMRDIHDQLAKEIDRIEKQRILLAKELTRRVKKDLDIGKGPGDIDKMLNDWLQKYTYIGRTKQEIEHFKKNASDNKALMKKT